MITKAIKKPRPDFYQRFWSNVTLPPLHKRHLDCWPWAGPNNRGYGSYTFKVGGKSKTMLAHRIAFELSHGFLDEGEVVRHFVCDNPLCCSPFHLRKGSQSDNICDMFKKGREGHGKRERLTKQEVVSIREMWASGKFTHESLAPLFNLTRTTILKVVNRLTWKEIP